MPSFPSPFTHAFESCHFRRATLLSIYSSVRNLFPLPDGGGSVTTAHRTYDDEDKNDDDGGGVNEGYWGSDPSLLASSKKTTVTYVSRNDVRKRNWFNHPLLLGSATNR